MAESNSAEGAMAESLNLMSKARDLLATPSHTGLASIVNQIFSPQETDERQTARSLYDFCVSQFPKCLTRMLLKVYRYSSEGDVVRFRSISLLSETLTKLRDSRGFELSSLFLDEIKPLLISCLKMPNSTESETKILRIIVSFVAYNVMKLKSGQWDELVDCILSIANSDPLRAFSFFLDLPLVYGELIDQFLETLLKEVYKILLNHEPDRAEDWVLALQTAVKLGIQLLNSETKIKLTRDILGNVLEVAGKLVRNGMEQLLERGLQALEQFLARDTKRCIYSSAQCRFVAEFAFKIAGIGTHSDVAANKIYRMVTKLDKNVYYPAFKLSSSLINEQESDLYNTFKDSSLVDILRHVAETEMDDSSIEIAMRRIHVLLCDHTSGKAEINISEIIELKDWLPSFLGKAEIPENTFRILGQVVFHVAHEMFSNQEDQWFDLWYYITTEDKTEFMFEKAVYIFQCLTMMLEDKECVIPAIDSLVPEIIRRLNSPIEFLAYNIGWVLAFTGGFCAVIQLIDVKTRAGTVKKIAYKMIDSVRELVERKSEVGLVRRGFRDMESIVKKQVDWYDTCEYKFVKGLLWKLYAIEGLRKESKIVLWRINVILEKGVQEKLKDLPKDDLDWLKQPVDRTVLVSRVCKTLLTSIKA